jgi:SsrA-binding protein
LRKKEIGKLLGATQGSGITLVPLRVYLKHGFAKLLLGVAKGKHTYDKRETLKRRDQDRELQRVMKNHG